ncbi:nuclease-related domain-containing protein [Marinicrinis sediminis]|uniref:Nuclease-related domain-containing protein n=1 Tax=Marinicrinis sediminis TaxID=1652465 RepID=A0ABW5RC67_9BACL
MKRRKLTRDYGWAGEQVVASELGQLPSEYSVLNRRIVQAPNGSRQEFDHIVVGPSGIFHIETKNWAGEMIFEKEAVQREEGRADVEDPFAQLYRQGYVLKDRLRELGVDAPVYGVLCMTHPKAVWKGKTAFPTMRTEGVVSYILKKQSKQPLRSAEIKKIVRAIREYSQSSK